MTRRKPNPHRNTPPVYHGPSLLTEHDIYLFKEGTHFRLYTKLGAHPWNVEGEEGTLFAVWAPNAESVSVIGDFNDWDPGSHPLEPRWDSSGIWEGFIPGLGKGALYKYEIVSKRSGHRARKGDPFAFCWEEPPRTASVVWSPDHAWGDKAWMADRARRSHPEGPQSIYEVHLGSWRREPEAHNRWLTYQESGERLVDYVLDMGFTHVEFLPLMEHPFYGSWGYQITGYFAPTRRYGDPEDLMGLIDCLHQNGIGVILDWVPSHFPTDEHGPAFFDGTHLFEHEDPRRGFHPDWKSAIFNYGRKEVRSFLGSSALFWLDAYHADGLRVDAVASMLYLDYSRKEGEWVPNIHGGRENLEAISLLQDINSAAYAEFPSIQMIAEESTAWPKVTRPVSEGGLGFGEKWNLGWMHDTLDFFHRDPVHRKFHHDRLTFSLWYAFNENFILPLSHDEVVHEKGSLWGKMPGDEWQKFANLRLLSGWMYTHPGRKLLFMGGEVAQRAEWYHEASLDWHLQENPPNRGQQQWIRDLNRLYREEPALHRRDAHADGFEWIDFEDTDNGIVSFLRKSGLAKETVLVIGNFTPVPRSDYRVGVPRPGSWKELLNSDALHYGGGGLGNQGGVKSDPIPWHGRDCSLSLCLPPLSMLILRAPATRRSGTNRKSGST